RPSAAWMRGNDEADQEQGSQGETERGGVRMRDGHGGVEACPPGARRSPASDRGDAHVAADGRGGAGDAPTRGGGLTMPRGRVRGRCRDAAHEREARDLLTKYLDDHDQNVI